MTQQPDKLFRNKLESLQLNAPSAAWSRIEAGLDKTSHKGLWLKIAAGLLLLAVAGVLIWNYTSAPIDHSIAEVQPDEVQTTPEEPVESIPEKATVNEPLAHQPVVKSEAQKESSIKKSTSAVGLREQLAENNSKTVEDIAVQSEPVSEIVVAAISPDEISESKTKPYATKYIVYTAEEVNQKYLRQQPNGEATSAGKKSSRMQMLMSVAWNLKNGDNGMGDLRQMKDEILALNFLDERKQQSKKN